jgi:hypothetical protein
MIQPDYVKEPTLHEYKTNSHVHLNLIKTRQAMANELTNKLTVAMVLEDSFPEAIFPIHVGFALEPSNGMPKLVGRIRDSDGDVLFTGKAIEFIANGYTTFDTLSEIQAFVTKGQ